MTTQQRQALYGVLALLGFGGTGYYNLQFAAAHDNPSLGAFVTDGMATAASSSLTMDVVVTCLVFFAFVFIEGRRVGMKHLWVYVPIALAGALAGSFPLFLLMRERALHAGS